MWTSLGPEMEKENESLKNQKYAPEEVEELKLFINSTSGASLQSTIAFTRDDNKWSNIGLIFTHPYAPLGGNMDNNVVSYLYHEFALLGYTVAKFNFR
jgi:alpha/beta superfamily hydrolase